ncbi:MAG: methyltransferase family protein [Gammaproteobacteria bacterium]
MFTKHLDRYVAMQIIILLAILVSTPYARINLHTVGLVIGIALLGAGACIMAIAFRQLGAALTSAVSPVQDGKLITTGIYSIVRHPMYSGAIMVTIGWSILWGSLLSLVFTIVLAVFFAFKAQKEEKLLNEKYHGYADYQARVKKKIIPYIY